MVHHPRRNAWLLLSALVIPATGMLALRHAVGPEARAEGRRANTRVWVTGVALPERGKGLDLTVETLSLVPEKGAEIPLVSPTGVPMHLDLAELRGGRIALAGAGAVPAGQYAALRVGLGGASLNLPLFLALDSGRELDLVVGVRGPASRPQARIASLEQR